MLTIFFNLRDINFDQECITLINSNVLMSRINVKNNIENKSVLMSRIILSSSES